MVSVRTVALALAATLVVFAIAVGSILLFASLGLYWSAVLVIVLLVVLSMIKSREYRRDEEREAEVGADSADESDE